MKATISNTDGTSFEIDLTKVQTITLSSDEVVVSDCKTIETPAEEIQEVISTEDVAPTVSEPPTDEIEEEDVEEVEPVEETVSEDVPDAKEEIPVEDAPVEKKDDAISDAIDEIVDMVSESISKTDDVPVSEVPLNAVGTEEDMIPTPKEEVVAVVNDTDGKIEVKPAESKKEEIPATVSFTEV